MGTLIKNAGHRLISEVALTIGEQTIVRHTGDWMYILSQLSLSENKRDGFNVMMGSLAHTKQKEVVLQIPLEFFFCKEVGMALPLIALQFHEVNVEITLNNASDITVSGKNNLRLNDCKLFVDYIYLDTAERRRFAQDSHTYLFQQLQINETVLEQTSNDAHRFWLTFNHPVLSLVTMIESEKDDTQESRESYANLQTIDTMNLSLNGNTRMSRRVGDYYKYLQPYQHYTSIPDDNIYVYSFALEPENHFQPSGSCNFSRVDNAQLNINTSSTGTLRVFAPNWNILRIKSGMGGLEYSN